MAREFSLENTRNIGIMAHIGRKEWLSVKAEKL